MVDLDDNRLDTAVSFGATHKINSSDPEKAIQEIYDLTDGRGVDVAIEAVGIPATFDLCQKIIGVDGTVANCGVHGKPVQFDLIWTLFGFVTLMLLLDWFLPIQLLSF